MQQLRSLLAADVTAYAGGGGKARAAMQPIAGLDQVMRVHAALAPLFAKTMSRLVRYGFINGLPGLSRSKKATRCRLPRCRSKMAKSPRSMSCAILTSSATSAVTRFTDRSWFQGAGPRSANFRKETR
jgi:hypothetical protein